MRLKQRIQPNHPVVNNMVKYYFEASDSLGFRNRVKNRFLIILLIVFIFCMIINYYYELVYAIPIGMIIFIFQYAKLIRSEKYFVRVFKIENNQIFISFFDKSKEKNAFGLFNDFKFEKKVMFNRNRNVYLCIHFQGNLLLKQYENDQWNEREFDKVIDIYNSMII